MAVVIRCPACKTKFRWFTETEGYPSNCPKCDAYVGHDRADDDVVCPNILSFSTRCQDGVYKAMEKASQERVYQAAEMAGCDASDMKDLKITNLRDNMKQGEIAAIPVVNDVTRQMDAIAARNPNSMFGFGGGAGAGLEFGAGVASGHIADGVRGSILPNAGARTQQAFRRAHADRMSGQLARGDVSSDRPANEIVQNPNYRSRV
jgi:hypothetical protein